MDLQRLFRVKCAIDIYYVCCKPISILIPAFKNYLIKFKKTLSLKTEFAQLKLFFFPKIIIFLSFILYAYYYDERLVSIPSHFFFQENLHHFLDKHLLCSQDKL